MAYGFITPKRPACTAGDKHKWTFVRNGNRRTLSGGGSLVGFSLRGIYKCACGETQWGRAKINDDTVNDVRDLPPQEAPTP